MSLCPSGRVSESLEVRLYIRLSYNELFATKTYNHGTALMPYAGKDHFSPVSPEGIREHLFQSITSPFTLINQMCGNAPVLLF